MRTEAVGAATCRCAHGGSGGRDMVPVEPRVHAKGPLVYGVFSALPTELTVLAANGSTVYTENLQATATEATQFCEGYAEPSEQVR
jgi:hypothetical protein